MKIIFYIFFFYLYVSCLNSKKNQNFEENIIADTLEQKVLKYKIAEIKQDKLITLEKTSEKFLINGITCFWEFEITIFNGATAGDGVNRLKNYNTHEVILSHEDYFDLSFFNSIDKNNFNFNGEFKDVNFDGMIDFIVLSKTGSGTSGSFFNVYLFNQKKEKFELSDKLSGGELNTNKVDKTVSTYWKMGLGWNISVVHHFEKKGKIKFTEIITREIIDRDTTSLLQTTYKKVANGKTIKTEINHKKFEGY